MSIQWSQSLIPEIAERRCILVLGAGASAGACSRDGLSFPPNWPTLLTNATDLLTDENEKTLVTSLIGKERYLDAAEIVVAKANAADYAGFIRRTFVDPHFQHSAMHEEVHKLDAKIVVTTVVVQRETEFGVARTSERPSCSDA